MIHFLGSAHNAYTNVVWVFPSDTTVLQFTITSQENEEVIWAIGDEAGDEVTLSGAVAAGGGPFEAFSVPKCGSYKYSGLSISVSAGDMFIVYVASEAKISVVMETSDIDSVPVSVNKRKFSSYASPSSVPRTTSQLYRTFTLGEALNVFCLPALTTGSIVVRELYLQTSFAHKYEEGMGDLLLLDDFVLANRPLDEDDDLSFPLPRHGTYFVGYYSESLGDLLGVEIPENPCPPLQLLATPITILPGDDLHFIFIPPDAVAWPDRSHGYLNLHVNAYREV